ncbi:hypothetical protein CK203_028199 [Vitis vinifera]|uniref:MuDRA-like transposase n=1 Tax=Vitis vinifera TaxID=29760 RepID=A0A438IAX7_VITVI|nr:hypothetical protein CK203_028199 [Vitis vinifera]
MDRRSENNAESMFMHGNGPVNDGSIESLNVVGDESIKKFNYEPLERSNVVEWNMNRDSSNKIAQIMEIHSIMNIKDRLMNDVPTMIEEVGHDVSDNRHTSSWLVGESMRQTYQVGCQYYPKDIIGDIQNKYGVQISYDKAWRAREFALNSIRGSSEESYGALPSYCYMLEQKNPGQ